MDEIDNLLGRLEGLGFFTIETNQMHDESDALYDFGDQYQEVADGLTYCILISQEQSRQVCLHNPQRDFVLKPFADMLEYLDNYKPSGLVLRIPDRILVSVILGEFPEENDLPAAQPWPDQLETLETDGFKMMYFEGQAAADVYRLFDVGQSNLLFSQHEVIYTLTWVEILPHVVPLALPGD